MAEEYVSEPGPGGPGGWRPVVRELRRQAMYLAVTALFVALVALALSAVATALQAGRDEARSADMALVVTPPVPPEALADHVFELYRRGYVPGLILAGEGQAGLKAQLVERGMSEALLVSDPAATAVTADLRRLARAARAEGASSLLVVTAPDDTLRVLKIVRDQGLRAYGSPAGAAGVDPLGLLAASLRYWRYLILGL